MRRRQSKIRMGLLRGRAGVLAYTLVGMVALVAIYYIWNSYYRPPAKINLFSVQGAKLSQHASYWDKHKFSVDSPQGQNKEIDIQKSEQWIKAHALQDLIDEENILEEKAAQQKVNNEEGASLQRPAVNRDVTAAVASAKQSPLFRPADPVLDGSYFTNLERLVHLDLKGAPPRVSYLEHLFPVLKKLGATGLLMEYEDMFPYSGNISFLAARNAYPESDLQRILKAAEANNLEIIPLVQTFGHMEFVLKHASLRHLREHDYTPQVITPAKEQSYTLIYNIIQQVIKAHPKSRRIHLGCDEVYGLGNGQSSYLIASQHIDPGRLFLRHVATVSTYIKNNFPKIRPLIWDDWLRNIPFDALADSGISSLVEPVVWYYQHNILDSVPNDRWEIYGRLFPNVWVASAFKGATGSAQILTNASVHLDNNLQWVETIRTYGLQKKKVNFRGMILTGWQRYDHFATLCELLPVGLPSLALSLQAVRGGGFGPKEWMFASTTLNCSQKLTLDFPALKKRGAVVTHDCNFPGRAVYYGMEQLWGILEVYKHDRGLQERISGWMTDLHLRQGFSNPGQMQSLIEKLSKMADKLSLMVRPMQNSLLEVFDNSTVDEWITTNLVDRINHFKDLLQKAIKLKDPKVWPARPFPKPAPKEEQGNIPGKQENSVIQGSNNKPRSEQKQNIGASNSKMAGSNVQPHIVHHPGSSTQNQGKIAEMVAVPQVGSQRSIGNNNNIVPGQGGNRPLMQALMPGGNQGSPAGPGKPQYITQSPSKNVVNQNPRNALSHLRFQPGIHKQIPQELDGKIAHGPPQSSQGTKLSRYSQQGLGQNPQEMRRNTLIPQYNPRGEKLPQNSQGLPHNSQRQPENPQGVQQNVHGQHPQAVLQKVNGRSDLGVLQNLRKQNSQGSLVNRGVQHPTRSTDIKQRQSSNVKAMAETDGGVLQNEKKEVQVHKLSGPDGGSNPLGGLGALKPLVPFAAQHPQQEDGKSQGVKGLKFHFEKKEDGNIKKESNDIPDRDNDQHLDGDEEKDGSKTDHLPGPNKMVDVLGQNSMQEEEKLDEQKEADLDADAGESLKYLDSFVGRRNRGDKNVKSVREEIREDKEIEERHPGVYDAEDDV